MGDYFTFHKTILGYVHKMKEIPCEDFSESCSDEDGQFHIAVVADGHGDEACMRSADGSRIAARITKYCLEDFAEKYLKEMAGNAANSDKEILDKTIHDKLAIDNNAREIVLKQLTDTIISYWFSFVKNDLKERPLSLEDRKIAGDRLEHIYGTTLIAALMLPDYLILLQQGDGRCDVFYEDGLVEQPIPWDTRCYENITTSMCDEDVVTGIRSHVIDLRERKVIACYLGTDGVEDSYRNMESTHNFYRSLTCKLNQVGKGGFKRYLSKYLPEFSRRGSGDDVSVSGIVDMDSIRDYTEQFQKQIKQYELEESLAQYENRKISMSRKYEMLLERKNEASVLCEEKEVQLKGIYNIGVGQWEQVKDAQKEYGKWQKEFDEYSREYQTVENNIKSIKEELAELEK